MAASGWCREAWTGTVMSREAHVCVQRERKSTHACSGFAACWQSNKGREREKGRSFLLAPRSWLLTENRLGLFYLQLRFGLVFFACGGKSVWSCLLTIPPPGLEIGDWSFFADWNLSSTELESGNAIGAFLQTPAPVLDKIFGPMGAQILSSAGLGSGNLIERAQFPPAPALDKSRSPIFCVRFPHCKQNRRTVSKKTSIVGKQDARKFWGGISCGHPLGWPGRTSTVKWLCQDLEAQVKQALRCEQPWAEGHGCPWPQGGAE